MATGAQTWSTTAGNNATADGSVNWAEGQAPSSVNNSARAEMASAAMWISDNAGTLLTSGSSSAFTVNSKQVSTAVVDGYTIAIRLHSANAAGATLNVDGVGAKSMLHYGGTVVTDSAFPALSVQRLTYTASSTGWIVQGFFNPAVSPITSVTSLAVTNSVNIGSTLHVGGAESVAGVMSMGASATVASSIEITGALGAASVGGGMVAAQSDQETATSLTKVVTPGRQHFHPAAAKAWAYVVVSGGTPVLTASYNVTSVTDANSGQTTVNFTTPFSSSSYAAIASAQSTGGSGPFTANIFARTSSDVTVQTANASGNLDNVSFSIACFGDL